MMVFVHTYNVQSSEGECIIYVLLPSVHDLTSVASIDHKYFKIASIECVGASIAV